MTRALFSVSSKQGIVGLARELVGLGWEIVASGGTGQTLAEAGIPVTKVERVTGQSEMLGGRVKTLHPAIHSAILARDTAEDFAELAEKGIAPISLVVCNLYPFSESIRDAEVSVEEAVEQIDIGGVTLLRAAAKNFARVAVLCDPADYSSVLVALKTEGRPGIEQRRELAVKAFAHCRDYDEAIHAYLCESEIVSPADSDVPEGISIGVQRSHELRYGENPHQAAAYYTRSEEGTPLGADQLAGKQLSYNNILDVDAAWRAVCSFEEPDSGDREALESDRNCERRFRCGGVSASFSIRLEIGLWRYHSSQSKCRDGVCGGFGRHVCRGDHRAELRL